MFTEKDIISGFEMIRSIIHKSLKYLSVIAILGPVLTSCADDLTFKPLPEEEDTDAIHVGASVKANVKTRRYIDHDDVEEGNFILSYPISQIISQGDTTFNYSHANVKFGVPGAEKLGFVTYPDPLNRENLKELKWSDIHLRTGNPGTAIFYLDNVPEELEASGSTDDYVVFRGENDEGGNLALPYIAGVFDNEEGTNDLLWGWAEAAKNTKKVNFVELDENHDFSLHHNMARFRVIITTVPEDNADNTNNFVVNLSKEVKVELTNIKARPQAYERTTGNLILPEVESAQDLTTLTLVDIDGREFQGLNAPEEGLLGDNVGVRPWKEFGNVPEDETGKSKVYTTVDFVLPPQSLSNESDRPQLRVTVPAKYAGWYAPDEPDVVYEAFLPQNMFAVEAPSIEDEDDDDVTANRRPMTLSFLKGHILTIRAKIGPPDIELSFAPVYVEEWVDMKEHSITGNQAGIYSTDDFMAFLNCYANENWVLLEKYGYKVAKDPKDETIDPNDPETQYRWVIMFWSASVKPVYNDIFEYLKDKGDSKKFEELLKKHPFSFSFNNYVINVQGTEGTENEGYGQLSGAAGQIRLYNWVTGGNLSEPGITTKVEFFDMINNGYSMKNNGVMNKYGAYDNTGERWVFEFTTKAEDSDLVFKYGDIHGKMKDDTTGAGNFIISFRGHRVTITDLPNGESMILEGEEGETLLHAILVSPAGIFSLGDVDLLKKAYNSIGETQTPDSGSDSNSGTLPQDLSWILDLYGSKNATTGNYSFVFRRGMTIDGPDIYGSLLPDKEKGRPDYSFTTANSSIVKVADTGNYIYQPAMADLKKLFAAAGEITNATQLNDMITYVNNGNPIYRRYYGKLNELAAGYQWEYPVNGTFSITFAEIYGKITSAEPFTINILNEHKVTVTGMPNNVENLILRGKQGSEILKDILLGIYLSEKPEAGFETSGDFKDMIAAYNDESKKNELELYGYRNEEDTKWIFCFTPTAESQIELTYDEIHGKMKKGAGEFEISLGNRSIKVSGLQDGGNIVLSGAKGEVLLHAILTDPKGMNSLADLQLLIEAYNNKTEWILDLFGTESEDIRTFNFKNSLQVKGEDIYGKMKPDTGNGLPEYKFSYTDGGVQVTDGEFTANVAPDNLKKLMAETGKISTSTDLTQLAANAPNSIIMRYYGKFSNNKWLFPLTSSMSISWNAIDSKLQNLDFDLNFESEVEVTVTNLPPGYRPIVCKSTDSPNILKQILTGTYPTPVAGIFDLQDLKDLIAAYGSGNTNNMLIYGTNTNGWKFIFRNSQTLQGSDIFGKMIPGADYNFEYASSVVINVEDGASSVSNIGVDNLKKLFSNSGKITNATDLKALITNQDNSLHRRFYGLPAGSTMNYPVSDSFSIAWNDINGMMKDHDFTFSFSANVKVTITGQPEDYRPIVCEGTDGPSKLVKILKGTYQKEPEGVYNATEFGEMISCYNNNQTEKLKLYGTLAGNKWTFNILTDLNINGALIYGNMIPGGNRKDYDFLYNNGSVKVNDGSISESVTAENLKVLFTNGGNISNVTDFTNMLTNYDNPVIGRYYGTYNGGTWTYPVTSSLSVSWTEIYNKLEGTENFNFSFATGVKVTVTNIPEGYKADSITCTPETLKQIINGSYPDPEPDPEPDPDENGNGNSLNQGIR